VAADRLAARSARIVSIVGTRPEAIKLRPVVSALAARGLDQQVILTGQHQSLASAFAFLAPDNIRDLGVDTREQSAGEICDAIHYELCELLDRHDADLILVQGDTSSAYAGALAARDQGIALGHVEAGLRTFDLTQPWPEEGYRIAIDGLSDLLFAPSDSAARNLAAEPAVRGAVHLTGNSGIDAAGRSPDSAAPLPSGIWPEPHSPHLSPARESGRAAPTGRPGLPPPRP
jgi:UDP-N-acetylglucosamine 2-epimerase